MQQTFFLELTHFVVNDANRVRHLGNIHDFGDHTPKEIIQPRHVRRLLLEKISPVKGILRHIQHQNDNQPQQRKRVTLRTTMTSQELNNIDHVDVRPTGVNQNGGQGAKKKTVKKKVPKTTKRVIPVSDDTDSEAETFNCEYCRTDFHLSVIECEKCQRWGCPECTKKPAEIHAICCKWGIHFYCATCEPATADVCKTGISTEEECFSQITRRGK
jgi:hypothetical protein